MTLIKNYEPIYVGRAMYTKEYNTYNFYVNHASDLSMVHSWVITTFDNAYKCEKTNIISMNSPLDNATIENMAQPIIPFLMTRKEARKIYLRGIVTPYLEKAKLHIDNCIAKFETVRKSLDNYDFEYCTVNRMGVMELGAITDIDVSNLDAFLIPRLNIY